LRQFVAAMGLAPLAATVAGPAFRKRRGMAPTPRIQLAPAAVCRRWRGARGAAFHDTRLWILDAHDGGIARTRPRLECSYAHWCSYCSVIQRLGRNRERREQFQKSSAVRFCGLRRQRANQSAAVLLSSPAGEAMGRWVYRTFFPPKDAREFSGCDASVVIDCERCRLQLTWPTTDGIEAPLLEDGRGLRGSRPFSATSSSMRFLRFAEHDFVGRSCRSRAGELWRGRFSMPVPPAARPFSMVRAR